jgi:6-phosphogluconolactonase
MRFETLDDAGAAAARGAALIAERLQRAVAARGRATAAISGGHTPLPMLRRLAELPLPWARIDVFQVDERIAPDGHEDRNATHQRRALAPCVEAHGERFHWMPVTEAAPSDGAGEYAALLAACAGSPPALDVVQLGLGEDGHTASLFGPTGAAEQVTGDVAVSGVHGGRRRMTLTLPVLNRAAFVLWLVTGESKRGVLERFIDADSALVAVAVRRDRAYLIADAAAAGRRPTM